MDTSNFKEVFESPKVKELTAQVAALESEVMRLRGALEIASGFIRRTNDEYGVDSDESEIEQCVQSTLSTTFTPTALNELIEKVEKRTIGRCAVITAMSIIDMPTTVEISTVRKYSKAINALPVGQIRLSELSNNKAS